MEVEYNQDTMDEHADQSDTGLVSVIIPHYNAESYLPNAIMSVRKQNYSPIEIIIVDSSDSYIARTLDKIYPEVIYETQEPKGVAAARNHAIEIASGKFIALLDADDLWLPNKLSLTIPELVDNDVVYSDMYILRNGQPEYYESRQYDDHIDLFKNSYNSEKYIPSRTVVANKYVFERWRFNEDLKAREDPNLWTKLLSEYEFKYLNFPTGIKTVRDNSLTSNDLLHIKSMLNSLDDLVETFPELRQYERMKRIDILSKYSKSQLDAGNHRESFRLSLRCILCGKINMRLLAILVCSVLPKGGYVFDRLSDLKRVFHNLYD
jgi:glycosyltransferase involved in cell wall biosynthesis